MKTAYSPGTWKDWRRGEESIYIMAEHPALPTMNVARVFCDAPDEKEGEANARLIAAAPDLLEALEAFFACDCGPLSVREMAIRAITKATEP